MYFKDKTIWITGASSGIGAGLARALAKEGAHLLLSSRQKDKLEQVKAELPESTSVDIIPIDMSDNLIIDSTCEEVLKKHQVDIVFLNAGISQRSTVLETKFSTEKQIMDVNYHGAVRLTKHILPQMIENGRGHFVVMSSVSGKIGVPGRSTYSASKHALHGYFDSLRAEVEDRGIWVTIICPGYIYTNISSNALLGDGSPQNSIDRKSKEGMSVDHFTKKVLRGVVSKKREMLIGGREILGVYLKRFWPNYLFKAVKKIEP